MDMPAPADAALAYCAAHSMTRCFALRCFREPARSARVCSSELAKCTTSKRPCILAHSLVRAAGAPATYSPNDMCCIVTTWSRTPREPPAISARSCSMNRSPSLPSLAKYSMFLPNSSITSRTGAAAAMLASILDIVAASGIILFCSDLTHRRSVPALRKVAAPV